MQKEKIQREIIETEKKILSISQSVFEIKNIDTMNDWLVNVLDTKVELAKSFHLPTEAKIKTALLILIQNQSLLTSPIINLLSKRISAFIATIGDLYNHKLRGAALKDLLNNFEPLIRLIKKYNDNFEHSKSIKLVSDALKTNRLHIYKSSPKEPDLRVALRAFYEDKTRTHKKEISHILDFVLVQLSTNVKKSGFISQPRHSWWAVLTLFSEANENWLTMNKSQLNKIIKHLINESEYSSKSDADASSIVPELDSPYNERTWVTVNAIRLFKFDIEKYIPLQTIKSLKEKIDLNFNLLIDEQEDDSIKNYQSKLILLYDMLGFINRKEALKLSRQKEIVLSNNYIGQFIYDDSVIQQYKNIYSSIQSLVTNRSSWKKHIHSSILICGSPGQGKSELCKQLSTEIKKLSEKNKKTFEVQNLVIGTNITSGESLKRQLEEFRNQKKGKEKIQVVIFDEFDKADFDFYTPFLPFLEESTKSEQPLTFWIFAQSSFPTFEIFKAHAETLEKKSMKDFATRIKLGTIDLSDLKLSPQQKLFTTLGYAIYDDPSTQEISKECFLYFATDDKFQNSRDITGVFSKETIVRNSKLLLSKNKKNNSYIKIIK